ncbi:DUF2169 domain-containing protein [soil metagenome]
MRIVKPAQLSLSTRTVEFRRRIGLCVTAHVYVPMSEAGRHSLFQEMTMWPFVADQLGANAALDDGVVKTNPEFIVCATAYPPQRPATHCAVRARVGAREKTLLVFGDRYWDHDRASAPAPFESMPILWNRAYGGPDYPANPIGVGRRTVVKDGIELRPLPNIELPDPVIVDPGQAVPPAGFGTLDAMWAQRAALRGSYDKQWYEQHSPGLAPDTDWRHFNVAPADQWFGGPLRGDEPFEFTHLHPTRAVVSGSLPGIGVHCFVKRGDDELKAPLSRVPMALTTIWCFPHVERMVLTFQGMTETRDELSSDLRLLMGGIERIGSERDDQHYLDVLARRDDPDHGAIHSLIDADLTPEGMDIVDPSFEAVKADFERDGLFADAQFRRAELEVLKTRIQIKNKGLDPDELNIRMPVREKPPTLSELPAYIDRAQKQAALAQLQSNEQLKVDLNRVLKTAKDADIDLKAATHRGPPTYSAAAHVEQIKSAIAAAGPASRPDLDMKNMAKRLVDAELHGRVGYLRTAHAQAAALPMSPQKAAAIREELAARLADGKPVVMTDLTGADLSGLDLSGHDFSHSWLESANLEGARLDGCNFESAVLAHARLNGTSARGARFQFANLGKATLAGAVLAGADMRNAAVSEVDLASASFEGAVFEDSLMIDAALAGADWREVKAANAKFYKRSLNGAKLTRADLSGAAFIECTLDDADLSGAKLVGATFVRCTARSAKLHHADLSGASFADGCDFTLSDFSNARLDRANLRQLKVQGALFADAPGEGIDLSEAVLDGCDLTRARFPNSLMTLTQARNVRAAGVDLMNAMLTRSDWRGSDLRGANLYGADLSRIRFDEATLTDGINGQRARIHPRWTGAAA